MGDELEWIKWYPHKYLDEVGLRFVSLAAEGLWIELLMKMHSCSPYGNLILHGRAPSPTEIVRMIGKGTPSQVSSCLQELERANVFSQTDQGVIYCRRMVRDNRRRVVAAANGSKGGNPNLLNSVNQKVPSGITKNAGSVNGCGGHSVKTELKKELKKELDLVGRGVGEPFALEPSSGPIAGKPARQREKARTKIPEDWYPDIPRTDTAAGRGIDVPTEVRKFVNHHTAKGNLMANWEAAWETWVDNAIEFQRRRG